MTAPGPRDPQAGQDGAAFTGWMEAQGYNPDLTMVCSNFGPVDMREAFTAGVQYARDLDAATLAAEVRAGHVRIETGPAPAGEPLTHFFHCWRFPDHHACAVALIERQGEERDHLIVRAAAAERELAEARQGTVAAQPSPGPVPGKSVRCPAGRVIRRVDYTQPQHPRRIHQDGTPCDHPGSISIGEPDPAPGWTAGGPEDALLANIDGLSGLVRDMLQAFPDTADEQDWRDRAGQLHVCDPDGQPYRAYTEEDL